MSAQFEIQKNILKEILSSGCNNCKNKIKMMEDNKYEIDLVKYSNRASCALKKEEINIEEIKKEEIKKEEIEAELEKIKTIKDPIYASNNKSKTIEDNNDNKALKKIEKANIPRGSRKQEENLILSELKVSQEKLHNIAIRSNTVEKSISIKSHSIVPSARETLNEYSSSNRLAKSPMNNRLSFNSKNNTEKSKNYERNLLDLSQDIDDSYNYANRSVQGEFISTRSNFSLNGALRKSLNGSKLNKEYTAEKIMKFLNMTEKEYNGLPKKVRMELYECLFAHKEKCDANCEHLRRAMMIQLKNKAQLYPMKKYTIF